MGSPAVGSDPAESNTAETKKGFLNNTGGSLYPEKDPKSYKEWTAFLALRTKLLNPPKRYIFRANLAGDWRVDDASLLHITPTTDAFSVDYITDEATCSATITKVPNSTQWMAPFGGFTLHLNPISDIVIHALFDFGEGEVEKVTCDLLSPFTLPLDSDSERSR